MSEGRLSIGQSLSRARLFDRAKRLWGWGFLEAAILCQGCGGAKTPDSNHSGIASGQRREGDSRCEYKGRGDRDVVDAIAPGAQRPNVRRVYGYVGKGHERRRVLLCREVDTNFDGQKDLLRIYDDHGNKVSEQADSNYDGRMDTWITFDRKGPSLIEFDKKADGQVDERRFYIGGVISRVERDTNADQKSDIFEIYRDGRLERMGRDTDFDGSVDVWHRDELRSQEIEQEETSKPGARAGSETNSSDKLED